VRRLAEAALARPALLPAETTWCGGASEDIPPRRIICSVFGFPSGKCRSGWFCLPSCGN